MMALFLDPDALQHAGEAAAGAAVGGGGVFLLGWKLFLEGLIADVRAIKTSIEGTNGAGGLREKVAAHDGELQRLEAAKVDKDHFLHFPQMPHGRTEG